MTVSDSYVGLRNAGRLRLADLKRSRWFAPLALAVPFIVAVAALRGLTATLPIFHSDDELVYHYPTILRFSHQLPFPDLVHYKAAQTPLFHVLMAYVGKGVGFELWRLRLVQVLISYLLALSVFGLLHRRLALARSLALALTLLFVLSPYVYGTSFRLITDNLALLFSVLAIERFERARETERLGPLAAGCACVAAAMLTRQSTAFLLPVAGLYALRVGRDRRRRALGLLAVAVSAVPVGLLFLAWHGLVPPGGDPSSCGLCPTGRAGPGARQGALEVQSTELTLATIGLYGAVLFAPLALPRLLADRGSLTREVRAPLLAAAACGIFLLAFPATPGRHAAGAIWHVAGNLPTLAGSSLVFWVLVPLAGAVLAIRLPLSPRPWLTATFLGCFLVGALAVRYPW